MKPLRVCFFNRSYYPDEAAQAKSRPALKICFINRYFFPDLSATAQLLTELAEDLDDRGETVTVITGRAAYLESDSLLPAREMYKGIYICRVRSSNFGRTSRLGRLIDYISFYLVAFWAALCLRSQDCFVVLSDPPLLSLLALGLRVFKRVKTVCWLQDVFPEIAVRAGFLPAGLLARLLQQLSRWSLRRMDHVVVLGRCMERHLLACGIPAHKLVQVSNWADGKYLWSMEQQENTFLAEHRLQHRFVVMYSGNLGVIHEFETIEAVIRGLQSESQICFCFIGEGYQKKRLVEAAQQERWSNVLFLPYQTKEALRSSLTAGDVHLVSLRSDMAGLSVPSKLYGILAVGRPVIYIGPEESEVALVIREGKCGYVIRPGDVQGAIKALLACYHDRVPLKQRGQEARAHFQRFYDRPVATEQFWCLLQRVTA